jgi:hypothetical protein
MKKIQKVSMRMNSEYFSGYKKIRNRLRQYGMDDIFDHCLSYIHPTQNSPEDAMKQPWLVMLILKWSLSDPLVKKVSAKKLNPESFKQILQNTLDLSSTTLRPNYETSDQLTRPLVFQQFYFQQNLSIASFSRQFQMYEKLPSNHSIDSTRKCNVLVPKHFIGCFVS